MSVITHLARISIAMLLAPANYPLSIGHFGFPSPNPDGSRDAVELSGSWSIGDVAWTEPRKPEIRKGDKAVLTVAVSVSSNISENATVILTVAIITKVGGNPKLAVSPAQYELRSADIGPGQSTSRQFTVMLTEEPAVDSIDCVGRALLEGGTGGTSIAEPYVDSANKLRVCPRGGCLGK